MGQSIGSPKCRQVEVNNNQLLGCGLLVAARTTTDSSEETTILHYHQRLLLAVPVCLVIAFCGCDKKEERFEIRGQVTFQGEPIAEGKLLFMPNDESQAQAIAKIVDGEYTTASPGGVFVGEYKVQIFGYRKTGKVQDLGELHGTQEQQEQFLPAKFNRETELTVAIKAEETNYDFEL